MSLVYIFFMLGSNCLLVQGTCIYNHMTSISDTDRVKGLVSLGAS